MSKLKLKIKTTTPIGNFFELSHIPFVCIDDFIYLIDIQKLYNLYVRKEDMRQF